MNIGIITHNYSKNEYDRKDAGVFVTDFSEDLAKKVKVHVYNLATKKKLGKLKWWNPIDEIYALIYLIRGAKDTGKLVKTNEITFLLSMWAFPAGLLAYYSKKRFGTPYGVWCLGSDIYIYAKIIFLRFLIAKILKNADICFGNSFDICREAEKLSSRKCIFLPAVSRIDVHKIGKRKLDIRTCNLLFVGRLEHIKGPDILAEAARILNETVKDFHIYFIGDGSLTHGLKDNIKKYKLDKNVFFLGNIGDRKILSQYLEEADALVIPSRSESMPLVFTEAIRCGLPVIASNVGDLPHFIKKNNVGLIFKSGNTKELAKLLKYAIIEKGTFKKRYRAGIKKLAREYNSNSIINKFLGYISNYE